LRYFSLILVSKCCLNYLCHHCADELDERERKVENFTAGCPYNCEGKFDLVDVNPEVIAKRYSDSQYMSFYSNNKAARDAAKLEKFDKENLSPGFCGLRTVNN
jgi:hypothetical protein